MGEESQHVTVTVEYTAEMEVPFEVVESSRDAASIAEDIFWSHAGEIVSGQLSSSPIDTEDMSISGIEVGPRPGGTAD